MVVEPLKKFAVGDMPPSPTTSNSISNNPSTHKKPTRHHYKRRSSGRIHVNKLVPMAKAHSQQQSAAEGGDVNNIDDDDDFEDIHQQKERQEQHAPRKPIKRTHSNKSIHRLSSIDPQRKVNLPGLTMSLKTKATSNSPENHSHQSPPITPIDRHFQQRNPSTTTTDKNAYAPTNNKTDSDITASMMKYANGKTKTTPVPSFQVSHQATAAPIANTLNATANTLVTPDKAALANLTTSNNPTITITTASATAHNDSKVVPRTKHLCSRFIREEHTDSKESHIRHKLPINEAPADDRIRHHFNITSRNVDKEHHYIQNYQDPLMESLTRCMKQRRQQRQNINMNQPTQSSQSQLQRLAQRGFQQRTLSSSILPTMSTITSSLSSHPAVESSPVTSSLHHEQHQYKDHRQMARQRYQRLQAAHASSIHHHSLSASTASEISKQPNNRWSAGALLDRVFNGAS